MGVPQYTLNDGTTIPAIGLGTWPLKGQEAVTAIAGALDVGYRLVDSAFNYENEGAVGAAVRASSVPREEIVVTSKLPGRHHAHDAAVRAIEESVLRTGLDHLDLYLIHWPNPNQHLFLEAWQAMVEARDRGLLRSIGTSNFLPEHVAALVAATGVAPAVNQIELHPLFPQGEQHAYDEAHGVRDEAWSPFGRGNQFLTDPHKMAFHAHALKSMSLNLGAIRLAELCQKLEEMAHSGNEESAARLAQELERTLSRTREELLPLRTQEK